MIGLEMAIMTSISYAAESQYDVVRREERAAEASALLSLGTETTSHSQRPRTKAAPPPKWSDTIRSCPAWRVNSLESIVPENLPRPSARRRTEAARFAAGAREAPVVKLSAGGCFYMQIQIFLFFCSQLALVIKLLIFKMYVSMYSVLVTILFSLPTIDDKTVYVGISLHGLTKDYYSITCYVLVFTF